MIGHHRTSISIAINEYRDDGEAWAVVQYWNHTLEASHVRLSDDIRIASLPDWWTLL